MAVTLTVEDGSGLPNANAYIDVAFADDWHTNMDHGFWLTLNTDAKSSSIVKATMYMDQRFKKKYRGLRQAVEQALGWPRIGAFDDDSFVLYAIPYQIQRACAEYALRAAWYKTLSPDPLRHVPSQDFSSFPLSSDAEQPDLILGPVRSKTQRVGPLEEVTTYDGANLRDKDTTRAVQTGIVDDWSIPEYPEADLWLDQVLRNSATGTVLTRGS